MSQKKYSEEIIEDFIYNRNEIIKLTTLKTELYEFLRANNFVNNTDSKDYTIFCHKSNGLIVHINKKLIETLTDPFILLYAFHNEWFRNFSSLAVADLKEAIIKIIDLSAK